MRSVGNGLPEVCASNIMRIRRGEVPYERIKGVDPAYIDRPSQTIQGQVREDIRWAVETYEPRVDVTQVGIDGQDALHGNFSVNTDIDVEGGQEDA